MKNKKAAFSVLNISRKSINKSKEAVEMTFDGKTHYLLNWRRNTSVKLIGRFDSQKLPHLENPIRCKVAGCNCNAAEMEKRNVLVFGIFSF